jgi:alpha-N-arabinofuranosidase
MYWDKFGTLPVAVSGNSPQPTPKYPPYGDQPDTTSGSSTYPLDTVAALTSDRKYLTVAVVNATESAQRLDLNVTGARVAGESTLYEMTGKDLDASNKVGQAPEIQVKETDIGAVPQRLTVAPISVDIYRFPLAGSAQ